MTTYCRANLPRDYDLHVVITFGCSELLHDYEDLVLPTITLRYVL